MNAATTTKFVQQLCETLKWAYKTVQQVIKKKNQRHKQNYDHKIRCNQLGVGNQVLLKRTAFKGNHKIQDHLENTVYCFEGQPYSGFPVFSITLVTERR